MPNKKNSDIIEEWKEVVRTSVYPARKYEAFLLKALQAKDSQHQEEIKKIVEKEFLGHWYGEALFTDSEPKKVLAFVKHLSEELESKTAT